MKTAHKILIYLLLFVIVAGILGFALQNFVLHPQQTLEGKFEINWKLLLKWQTWAIGAVG